MSSKNTTNIDITLKKLDEIASWFDSREQIDVEQGLAKVKEASALILDGKKRLSEIENEFEEIKKELNPNLESDNLILETTETVITVETPDDTSDIPF